MAPSRTSSSSNALTTAYSLSLLTEYTNNLDTLPIELSRNFADLRELDAVLSSSMTIITAKINALTTMIEEGTIAKEERLWLLTEIASEAARLKPGADDKIRVACQAADNLKSHSAHLRTLLEHLPSFDTTTLNRKTTYPHVAPRSFMPSAHTENGRRRRGGVSSLLASGQDPSPPKRKRPTREDDDVQRTPRKDKSGDGAARQRNGRRAPKKNERGASPAESLVSVASHIPPHQNNSNNGNSRTAGISTVSRTNGNHQAPPPNKRSRPSQSNVNEHLGGHHAHPNGNARREMFNAPPSSSSSHPSLPLPYGGARNDIHGYDIHHSTNDWLPAHQLEGPGMPVARAQSTHPSVMGSGVPLSSGSVSATPGGQDASVDGGEGEGEGDDRTYCFCDGVSYGEMIACDDETCEREWFHLACTGLTVPPDGTWYCETCQAKRNARRNNRSGKRRTGGGGGARSGNKSAGAA